MEETKYELPEEILPQIIKAYRRVKRRPYRAPEYALDPYNMSCYPKALMLKKSLEGILSGTGYEVRMGVALFNPEDQSLPPFVYEKANGAKFPHFFVVIEKGGKKIILDPTNDPALDPYEWDGKSEHTLAVRCFKVLSPQEGEDYMREIFDGGFCNPENGYWRMIREYRDFFSLLNSYLIVRRRMGKEYFNKN